MSAPTFVEENIATHDGDDGAATLGGISGADGKWAFAIVSFNGGTGDDDVVLSDQGANWTVLETLDDTFADVRWYLLRGFNAGLWSPGIDVTGSTSSFGSADGYFGGIYICSVVEGEGTLFGADVGSFPTPPPDWRTAPHTAEANALAFHCWHDTPVDLGINWEAAPGGEDASRLGGQQTGLVEVFVFGVELYTYSSAGAKSGVGGTSDFYGSNTSPVTAWAGFAEAISNPHWGILLAA